VVLKPIPRSLCLTGMRGRQPNPRGESLTARQKRVFAIVGGLLIVLVAGVSAWAAVSPGRYGRSANGCVTVVEPSSTGGAVLRACGSQARAMCRHAFTHRGQLDLLTRPQCRLAGIAPQRP
jgi:hypothetical protein